MLSATTPANVRLWHKADIATVLTDVCFRGKADMTKLCVHTLPLSGMFTIMIGTQGIAAQWLYWAAAAYLIYRLMLIAETGSDILFIATLFLVLVAAIQRPLDMDAWEPAAEF